MFIEELVESEPGENCQARGDHWRENRRRVRDKERSVDHSLFCTLLPSDFHRIGP